MEMLVFWLCFEIPSSRVQRSFSLFFLNLAKMFVFISDVLMRIISQPLVECNLVEPPSSSEVFSDLSLFMIMFSLFHIWIGTF